ncbi:MAG: hypothetical protein P8Y53_13830, partial [Pseudolabrys sp.]
CGRLTITTPSLCGFGFGFSFVPECIGRLGQPLGIISQVLNLNAGEPRRLCPVLSDPVRPLSVGEMTLKFRLPCPRNPATMSNKISTVVSHWIKI